MQIKAFNAPRSPESYRTEQFVHTDYDVVIDKETAKKQSPSGDDDDVFWFNGDYKGNISYFRERVFSIFDQNFQIGEVWECDDGSWAAQTHDRSFVFNGFKSREYACEFLDQIFDIRGFKFPKKEDYEIDLGWDER